MADTIYNYGGDAFNNDAFAGYHNIKSAYYSGAFANIIAPGTQNYPPAGTATRYAIYLPVIPYTGDYITYPMNLRDVTSSVTLTRVSGTPGANEYRVAPATSKTPQVIELHSGQAGHVIGFEYYGLGSVLAANPSSALVISGKAAISGAVTIADTTDATSKDTGALVLEGGIGCEKAIYTPDYITAIKGISVRSINSAGSAFTGYANIYIIDIGAWNMQANAQQTKSIPSEISSGVGVTEIDFIGLVINNDTGTSYVNSWGSVAIEYTNVPVPVWLMSRSPGSIFDSSSFSSIGVNRGHIIVLRRSVKGY